MQEEQIKRSRAGKIARIFLKVLLFLFLAIVIIFLLILTPPVQRFMTGKVENYLQKKLQTRVEIGSISFGLSGNIHLQDIYLEDRSKDTLLSGGTIKANVNLFKLFSNEVEVKDIELQNIRAKIRRDLPDTVFNFQFIADAFMSEKVKAPDTAATAPLKLAISDAVLDNVNLSYVDVVSGSDMQARIGNLSVTIDTMDINAPHIDIPSIIARNIRATIRQHKPLAVPEPVSSDIAEMQQAPAMRLNIGTVDLNKISVDFENDVSAFYVSLNLGQARIDGRQIDMSKNRIYLDELALNNSRSSIRLGRKEAARVVAQEIEKEIEVQKTQGWDFRIGRLRIDNNQFKFDNDNKPRMAAGMDYAHIDARDLSLHADNVVFNTDSIGAHILKGTVNEKGGLVLQALEGEVMYAATGTSLRNLYIKTPGSVIRRSASMQYASFDALSKNFGATVMDLELVNTKMQVKDILVFAPQLRGNPAFSNPAEVWNIHIIGSGTLDRLHFETLQFAGLRNTSINAEGTLTGLNNPSRAGGDFVIHRLHTTETDLALFTGQPLSNKSINLPETYDINGTVRGNAGSLQTALNVRTNAGAMTVNGRFANLVNPAQTTYNATIRTSGLQLGRILRQEGQIGSLSGNFTVNGSGITPQTINTKFRGQISSAGYNRYQYRNISLNGTLKQSNFTVQADVNDPNADLNLTASGAFNGEPSFKVNGMIDSLKTQPLHLTTQPLVFRGAIDGTVAALNPNYMDASILITRALLVTANERLPLDTVRLVAGRSDTGNYISLRSDIANADIAGQYRMADLGNIINSSIQPYFQVAPAATTAAMAPYNFSFRADVRFNPVYTAFLPGLTAMEPLHIEGRFATGAGMNATATTPYIHFNGNEMSDLRLTARTTENGLNMIANVAQLKSGNAWNVYNTRINATALNNVIRFNLGIDDVTARNKYYFAGSISQPARGSYAISLSPDSLLLNYDSWTIPADNRLLITPSSISASNFVLQRGGQQLALQSIGGGSEQPLQVTFTEFRIGTITGFLKSDTALADGVINGTVTFDNILQRPVFTSNLTINDLSLKKDTIGNVNLQVSSGAGNRYNAVATITGRGNDVGLSGWFTPNGNNIDMNLDLAVRQLQLNTMEGALANVIENATGTINGNVRIRGSSADPSIQGDLNFNKASFALTVLGSQFNIDNERLSVTENGLRFSNFTIRDSANNALNINGDILTSNYINYTFGLNVNASNFMLLNSTKKQNKLYYGRLNISSNMRVSGTEVRPVVDGNITINDGTNLSVVVPQREPGIAQREGVVQFVDMDAPENDSLFLAYDSLNNTGILGMDIALNIEVTKEAILNVIIDEANGDFLNVQGEALLSAGIDPSGKITLVGNYSLENGAYEISFNFLRRRFEIEKGSTITWTGEPTTAQLNVTAVYIANTAPLDLVADQISASTPAIRNTYLQKLPFEVHLSLTGELMRPVIDFDILLPQDQNYGVNNDIVTAVQSRLSQIRQDEGEVNKQVFSLLLLGRFVGENPFESSGGGFSAGTYARQSVSRLLTEQLNQLAAGLVGGIEIDFDLASTEDYTTGAKRNRTDLNVGLSKRLLNDRLKVTVGSNFQLEGPQNSNQQSNNIAGNVAVDYQLTKDGRYLLRFFRRNQYEGVVDGYIVENGLSFILSVDYNRFRDILRRKKQRVMRNTDETNTESQTANPPKQ